MTEIRGIEMCEHLAELVKYFEYICCDDLDYVHLLIDGLDPEAVGTCSIRCPTGPLPEC